MKISLIVSIVSDLSSLVESKLAKLYGKYLSDDGKVVDYEGLRHSEEFKDYVNLSAQFQRAEVNNYVIILENFKAVQLLDSRLFFLAVKI